MTATMTTSKPPSKPSSPSKPLREYSPAAKALAARLLARGAMKLQQQRQAKPKGQPVLPSDDEGKRQMLTPSELESLRLKEKELSDLARKAWPRPK